jgi:membrane dipeptidase
MRALATVPVLCALALAFALALALAFAPASARADPPPCHAIPDAPGGVADLHVDLPYQVHYRGRAADLSRPGRDVDAASLRAGCVRVLTLSIYLPSAPPSRVHTLAELRAVLATADGIVRDNPALFAGPDAPVRAVYGIEGAGALAGHADEVPALVRRGVRLFGLTHRFHNALADSATDARPGRGGLTPEGQVFVRAVYAAGGLVDVSHSSDATFDAVARLAREAHRPIVATHSDARALADHPRNLTDAQLRAVAASGGVVGLNFHSGFLRRGGGAATLADVVRHAVYMARVMGAAHVAIGSDFDGEIRPPRGLRSHADLPALARALRAAGLSPAEVRGILGDNVRRVLGAP